MKNLITYSLLFTLILFLNNNISAQVSDSSITPVDNIKYSSTPKDKSSLAKKKTYDKRAKKFKQGRVKSQKRKTSKKKTMLYRETPNPQLALKYDAEQKGYVVTGMTAIVEALGSVEIGYLITHIDDQELTKLSQAEIAALLRQKNMTLKFRYKNSEGTVSISSF